MASTTHETPDIRTQYTSHEEHVRHAAPRPATKMVVIEGGAHRRADAQEQPAAPAHIRSNETYDKPQASQSAQPRHMAASGGGDPDKTMALTAADVARVREEARKLAKRAEQAPAHAHVQSADADVPLSERTDVMATAASASVEQDDPNRPRRVVRQAPTRRERRAAKHAQKLEGKHATVAVASTATRDSVAGVHARVNRNDSRGLEQAAAADAVEAVAAPVTTAAIVSTVDAPVADAHEATTSAPVATTTAAAEQAPRATRMPRGDAPVRKTVDAKPDKRDSSPKQPHGRRAKRAAQEQRVQAERTARERERREHEQWNDALKAIGVDPQAQRREAMQAAAEKAEEAAVLEAVAAESEQLQEQAQTLEAEQQHQRPDGAPVRTVVPTKSSSRRSRKAAKAAAAAEHAEDARPEAKQDTGQPTDSQHDAAVSADDQHAAPLIQTVVRNEADLGDRPQRVVVDGKSRKRGVGTSKKAAADASAAEDASASASADATNDTSSRADETSRGSVRAKARKADKTNDSAKQKRSISIHPVAGLKMVAGGVAGAAQKIGHGVATHRIQVAVVLAVVLVLGTMLYPAAREYYISVRTLDKANVQLAQITERNALIQEGIDQMNTDTGIEDYMRAQYGWVKRGENAVAVTGLDEGDKLAITRLDLNTSSSSAEADGQDGQDSLITQLLDAAFFVDTTSTEERHVITAEEAAAARAEAEAQAEAEAGESGSSDSGSAAGSA